MALGAELHGVVGDRGSFDHCRKPAEDLAHVGPWRRSCQCGARYHEDLKARSLGAVAASDQGYVEDLAVALGDGGKQ
ncbi:hypothetical protein D3C78_1824300 [compost metagenome]